MGEITQTDFGYTFQRGLPGTGLMDYRARFYAPYLNRFTQPDTIVPEPGNPQALNRYSYALNNSIRYNDPTGHWIDEGGGFTTNKKKNLNIISGQRVGNSDGDRVNPLKNVYTGSSAWSHNYRRNEVQAREMFNDQSLNCTPAWRCVSGAMERAFWHESQVEITGEIIDYIKNDPAIINLQDKLVSSVKSDPRYGVIDFTRDRSEGNPVTLGDDYGNMLVDATYPQTWVARAVNVDADIHATESGDIYINYEFADVLDLRPDWDNQARTKSGYNHIVTVLGFYWHEYLGASDQMIVYAHWMIVTK